VPAFPDRHGFPSDVSLVPPWFFFVFFGAHLVLFVDDGTTATLRHGGR